MTSPLKAPAAAALLALLGPSALAHATLDRTEAAPNAGYRGAVRIGHGCQGSPTTRVRVQIPEGVIGAKPMPKPGWTLATTTGPYARAYESHHGPVSSGVREIAWTGSLPDDQYDEFVFVARLTDAHPPGSTVHFPVVQECERGAHRWTELPGPGGDAAGLKAPAPGVRVVQAGSPPPAPAGQAPQAGHAPQANQAPPAGEVRAGSLTIAQAWTRATPGGARVAGGYLRVTNTGPEPDRLVAGTFARAGRVEVHEMATTDGVMRMRPVEGGLVIRPGETVELRPGGYHVMFMDLQAGLQEGETVRGTLTFERAGTVEVTYQVGRLGSPRPPGEHPH